MDEFLWFNTKYPMKKVLLILVALIISCAKTVPLTQQQVIVANDIKYEFHGKDLLIIKWEIDTIKQIDSINYGRYIVNVSYDSAGTQINAMGIYLLHLNELSIYKKYILPHK